MSGFDLHTHTVFSDGTTTPEDNVRDALAFGLDGLAVTDHDTADGYQRALAAADGTGLEVIRGVEFSAERDGRSVHVLGLWIDPEHPPLADELARLRDARTDRARRIVERFNQLGIAVRFERVVELAAGAPIGRPHIATAVLETGAVDDEREVYDRYLADGGPAYVEKHAVHPVRAVELLVGSGGVAVLAHPGLDGPRDGVGGVEPELIEAMAAAGMVGLEVEHPDHTERQRLRYLDVARSLELIVTGGSDYHGDGKQQHLGERTTPREVVEQLALRRG